MLEQREQEVTATGRELERHHQELVTITANRDAQHAIAQRSVADAAEAAKRAAEEGYRGDLRRTPGEQLKEPSSLGAVRSACQMTAIAPTTSIWRR